ncbi:MAG TPA: PEGA domain-containing protein, partial [Vicinamibacterales bacterium]
PTRDRLVAVKVFRLDIVPEQAQSLADELSRATEAGLFHPSIVEPIAAGVEGTLAYRAEEYVAAESLDVAMRHYAPAPLEKALPFITQLAGAIDFAKAVGVRHGGLHPRDIFVTPDEARATGFGVVEALERAGVRAPVRRPYSAPERIEAAEWGTPADVFALAAITFELLTGRRPSGTGDRIGALNDVGANASLLHGVLARAMDENPARRYPTALAFAGALEAASRGSTEAPAVVMPGGDIKADSKKDVKVEDNVVPIQAPPPPSLFDEPEPAAVVPIAGTSRSVTPEADEPSAEPAAAAGFTRDTIDEFEREAAPPAAPDEPIEGPVPVHFAAEERPYPDESYSAEPDVREAPERSRPAVLPIAVTLVAGLLLGFMAGYFVGGKDTGPSNVTTARQGTSAPPGPTSAANPSARQYSDQAVSPPPQQPRSTPSPTVPPPPVREDSAPPAPAATAARTPPQAPVATTGRIVVRSTPEKAGVTINGRWRGRTPLTLDKMPFGNYSVRVVQRGYRPEQSQFALSAKNTDHSMSVRLSRERPAAPATSTRAAAPQEPSSTGAYTGALFVDSRPTGANVLLDGRLVGKTPLRLSAVKIGSHVVRLELPEHQAWTASTRVSAGEESRVTGSLERLQ